MQSRLSLLTTALLVACHAPADPSVDDASSSATDGDGAAGPHTNDDGTTNPSASTSSGTTGPGDDPDDTGSNGDDTTDGSDTDEPPPPGAADIFFFSECCDGSTFVANVQAASVAHEPFQREVVQLSPDGTRAAAAARGALELWALDQYPPVLDTSIALPGRTFSFEDDTGWSPAGDYVVGYLDGELGIVRIGDATWTGLGISGTVQARISEDGHTLALVFADGAVELIDTVAMTTSVVEPAGGAVWWWPELSADGTLLSYYVGAAAAPSVRFVDLSGPDPVPVMTIPDGFGYRWAPTGHVAALREPGVGISVVDPDAGTIDLVIAGAPRRSAWSPDGSVLAAATTTALVRWDVAAAVAQAGTPSGDDVHGFSPDGRWLAFGRDEDLRLFDAQTGTETLVSELFYGPGHDPGSLYFDEASEALLFHDGLASFNAPVRLVDLGGGAPAPSVALDGFAVSVWRGASGLHVVYADVDDRLFVQRIVGGSPTAPELVGDPDGSAWDIWLPGPHGFVAYTD